MLKVWMVSTAIIVKKINNYVTKMTRKPTVIRHTRNEICKLTQRGNALWFKYKHKTNYKRRKNMHKMKI